MGGMLILVSLFFNYNVGQFDIKLVWLVFSITILFGLIGAYDDYFKLKSNSREVNSKLRLIIEFLISFLFIFLLNNLIDEKLVNIVYIPF